MCEHKYYGTDLNGKRYFVDLTSEAKKAEQEIIDAYSKYYNLPLTNPVVKSLRALSRKCESLQFELRLANRRMADIGHEMKKQDRVAERKDCHA
jgi:hypothetical protein